MLTDDNMPVQLDESAPTTLKELQDTRPVARDVDIADIIANSKDLRPAPTVANGGIKQVFIAEMPNIDYNPTTDDPGMRRGVNCRIKKLTGDETIMVEFRSRPQVSNTHNNKDADVAAIVAGQSGMSAEEIAYRWRIALTVSYGTIMPRMPLKSALALMQKTEDEDGVDGWGIVMGLYNAIEGLRSEEAGNAGILEANILAVPEIFGQLMAAYRVGKLYDYLAGNREVVAVIRNNVILLMELFKIIDSDEFKKDRANMVIANNVDPATIPKEDIEAVTG